MCEFHESRNMDMSGTKTVSVSEAVGMVIPHDITEIRPGEFKGRAFKKGHIVTEGDINHLRRLGKENLFVLEIKDDEMHENDAACAIARALAGEGAGLKGEATEGRIDIVAEKDGLLKVDREALFEFNMLGEVICATIHNNSVVKKGQLVAGTRAIPLIIKKPVVEEAVRIAEGAGGILSVKDLRRPRAGIVITGNEVYHGRIKDTFEAVITKKIRAFDGEVMDVYLAPDDAGHIEKKIRGLIASGADLVIATGGMSVDPDDVTRFAVRNLDVEELVYGSPVLPGSMFMVAYVRVAGQRNNGDITGNSKTSGCIPVLGIPACGTYNGITAFDLVLPRILAGERIGRKELAEMGHGGLCLKCNECRYPVCSFGKGN